MNQLQQIISHFAFWHTIISNWMKGILYWEKMTSKFQKNVLVAYMHIRRCLLLLWLSILPVFLFFHLRLSSWLSRALCLFCLGVLSLFKFRSLVLSRDLFPVNMEWNEPRKGSLSLPFHCSDCFYSPFLKCYSFLMATVLLHSSYF